MERILDPIGPWHIPVFLLALVGSVPYGLFVMSLSFMAPKLGYWCKPPSNIDTTLWHQMNEGVDLRCEFWKGNTTQKCSEWQYDHSFHQSTLVEQWDAVCDRHWMLATAQSCLMFGVLVGCFVFSHISDWYGRKKCYIISLGIIIVSGFGISFSTDFWMFCVLRFLMAMGHGGKRVSTALSTESVGPKHRAIVTVGQDIGWCLGLLIIPLITYYVRDWVLIQRIIVLPEFIFVVLACFLDESPKWLLCSGKHEETKTLLKKIIKRNKLDTDQPIDLDEVFDEAKACLLRVCRSLLASWSRVKAARKKATPQSEYILILETTIKETKTKKGTVLDLFRGWTVMKLTIACCGQYAVIILLYYHMMYFIVDIGSDPYMGILYMAALEIPITTAAWWVVRTFRRKPVYIWSYALAIGSGVALLFSDEDSEVASMIFANLGKMAAMFLYNCLLLHVSECFPTNVRSVALGSSAMASRVGAMAAPFLKEIGLATASWVPLCITITMCVLSLLLSFILPETFGQKLPDTFYETKQMMRVNEIGSQIRCCQTQAFLCCSMLST